jgi:hypothetical protein
VAQSGKLLSKKNLTELCPNGGTLEVVVQGPNLEFYDGRHSRYVRGIWPAIWLLGNGSWPNEAAELDLWEMMQFKAGDENKASSCAHFGPYKGKDFTGPGFWGLNLGSYVWDQQEHLIKFEWKKREDKAWQLTLTVDDRRVWSFATKHEGILDVGDRGGEGFKQGQPRRSGHAVSASVRRQLAWAYM